MAKEYLLAIDIGTESSRASLLDLEGGVVATHCRPLELRIPRPGWAEQDPLQWWATTLENVRSVIEEGAGPSGRVLAVGVSGQMHGTVPLGPGGELLSRSVQLWCDKRCASLVSEFVSHRMTPAVRRLSSTPPAPAWLGFKIRWLQLHEADLYQRTWKFLVPKDFINFQLTGIAATDPSEASGSFLLGVSDGRWSNELLESLELDPCKLPDIHPSSSVIGHVTTSAARSTGILQGTPVVAGGGDMLCALLAAGVTQSGRACDITGTSSHLSIYAGTPSTDLRMMNLHHVVPGWITFGIVDSAGGALKWFKDTLCQEEIRTSRETGCSPYALLDERAAEAPPGSEGLIFFPYLFGERTMGSPHARGVFFGLTPQHGKGALARAIMEGVTLELRRTLEIVEATGNRVDEVRTTGGGARSQLWSQIKADIYQKPVVTFETYEGSIFGVALLAGIGADVYPDARSGAERLIRLGQVFQPDPTVRARYDTQFEMYKQLHDAMQESFARYGDTLPFD